MRSSWLSGNRTSPQPCRLGCVEAGGGFLTALSKETVVPGVDPEARPTKAEDFDCNAWTKAAQQVHTEACRDEVTPQQLGVGVNGSVEIKGRGSSSGTINSRAKASGGSSLLWT